MIFLTKPQSSHQCESDEAIADKLFLEINNAMRKHSVFLDRQCLPSGKDWEVNFVEGLLHCRVALILLSESALKDLRPNMLLEASHICLFLGSGVKVETVANLFVSR